jgi:hypothetical protein
MSIFLTVYPCFAFKNADRLLGPPHITILSYTTSKAAGASSTSPLTVNCLYSVEAKNAWVFTAAPPIHLHGCAYEGTLLWLFVLNDSYKIRVTYGIIIDIREISGSRVGEMKPYGPIVVVEWLTLMLHIPVVPDSVLGPGDRLSSLRFSMVFLIPSRRIPDSTFKIRTRLLPTKSFPIRQHSPITDAVLCCYWIKVVNKLPTYQPWRLLECCAV